MHQKFVTMLGFAQRAGKIASGESAAQAMLQKKRVFLVILAQDASERTRSSYINRCGEAGIPWIVTGSQIGLGEIIGRSPRSVIVVTDEHFAQVLLESWESKQSI